MNTLKTLADITNGIHLTELERDILNYLDSELSDYRECISHVEHKHIADHLKLPVNTIKGGVGSLVKKDILETYSNIDECGWGETEAHFIYFSDQENMVASEGI